MAAFKTPLFWATAVLAAALALASRLGLLEPSPPSLPVRLSQGGYHFCRLRLGTRLAKGWQAEVLEVDGAPERTRVLVVAAVNPGTVWRDDFGPDRSEAQRAYSKEYVSEHSQRAGAKASAKLDANLPPRPLVRAPLHGEVPAGWLPGSESLAWARFQSAPSKPWEGTFDWGKYLAHYGISGTLYLDRPADARITRPTQGPLAWVEDWHERLVSRMDQTFADRRVAGLLSGLLLGEKRLLETSMRESFVRSGTMHLLVASGLHVASAFVFFLAVFLWIFHASRPAASLLALVFTWMFTLFIGMNPPTLRAALMLTLVALPGLRRESPALARLFLAAAVFLVWKPALIADASFLLSFASTLGILYGWSLFESPRGKASWLWAASGTSLFAWTALLPLSAHFFNQISLVGPLANLVLVPFSSVLLAWGALHFLFLDWVPFLSPLAREPLSAACGVFLSLAEWFSSFPFASVASAPWEGWMLCLWLALMLSPFLIRTSLSARWRRAMAVFLALWTAWGLGRRLSSATVEIFVREGRPAAALAHRGFRHLFCLENSPAGAWEEGDWRELAQSRGISRFNDSCADPAVPASNGRLLPRYPFSSRFFMRVDCGGRSLIFPFSIAPGFAEEEFFSVEESCPSGFL